MTLYIVGYFSIGAFLIILFSYLDELYDMGDTLGAIGILFLWPALVLAYFAVGLIKIGEWLRSLK